MRSGISAGLFATAVVCSIALSHSAHAAAPTLRQFIDGCNTDPITCIHDMEDAIILAETDAGVSCPADGVTDREAQAALNWMQTRMQAQPSLGNRPVSEIQQAAAQALWPCK